MLALDVATVFQLIHALSARAPGFAAAAEHRVAVAVNGTLVTDWSTPLDAASEVLLIPRVGGG